MSVTRTDFVQFSAPQSLAAGGVLLPATPSRTGIQEYHEDGRLVREYRPTEEVFHVDSLDSFRAAPVTLGHPQTPVTPESWSQLSVGSVLSVGSQPFAENGSDWVKADLSIQRNDAIDDVKSKRRTGLSVGYTCDIDETAGVTPDGQPYDRVQRNIRVNHLALLASTESPRAGAGARLRIDTQKENTMKVTLNGIEYEVGSDAHISALSAEVKKATERADSAEKDVSDVKAKLAAIEAERDAAVLRADSVDVDKAAEQLIDFRADAARVLGKDYSFAGKSQHQIRLDALEKLGAKVSDDSEDYVKIYFQARLDSLPAEFDYNEVTSEVVKEDKDEGLESIWQAQREAFAAAGGVK